MVLAIDIGNTSIKFGLFVGDDLISKFSIPTQPYADAVAISSALGQGIPKQIGSAIICSVVPHLTETVVDLVRLQWNIEAEVVTNDRDFGLTIAYDPLTDAGTDRLVNVYSAANKYGYPLIVCSFGTALTMDVVTKERVLKGGLIAPGMGTMAKALYLNAARLPEVTVEQPPAATQNTTVGSIRSGIFFGYLGLAEGLICRLKEENDTDSKVIATGGYASLVAKNTAQIDIVDENLLLDGLCRLHNQRGVQD